MHTTAKLIIPIVDNGQNLISFAIVQILMKANLEGGGVMLLGALCHSSDFNESKPVGILLFKCPCFAIVQILMKANRGADVGEDSLQLCHSSDFNESKP